MQRKCTTCTFYKMVGEQAYCLRSPPTLVIVEGRLASNYPPVDSKTFACGEHKSKRKPK